MPQFKNTVLMELDIAPVCEYSQKDAEMVEPCLCVADVDMWHCLSSRIRSVAGMVPGYDPAFPQLARGGTSQGDRDGVLGSSGKEGEGAGNHLLEWAQGWGWRLFHLERANTTVGGKWICKPEAT